MTLKENFGQLSAAKARLVAVRLKDVVLIAVLVELFLLRVLFQARGAPDSELPYS